MKTYLDKFSYQRSGMESYLREAQRIDLDDTVCAIWVLFEWDFPEQHIGKWDILCAIFASIRRKEIKVIQKVYNKNN